MNSDSRILVRDLVSYSLLILLTLIVFGTIWYLRAKFRKLLITSQANSSQNTNHIQYHSNSCVTMRANIDHFGIHQPTRIERRVQVQSEEIYYHTPFDRSVQSFAYDDHFNDSPPAYSTLAFPTDVISPEFKKARAVTPKMSEKPPPYGSILVVKPVSIV